MFSGLKKISVHLALALLRLLLFIKRKSGSLLSVCLFLLRWFFTILGGRRLLLAVARHVRTLKNIPPQSLTLRRSLLATVVLLAGGVLVTQIFRSPQQRSFTRLPLTGGETIEQQEFTGQGGPEFSESNVLELVPILPGLPEETTGEAIVEGGILVSPAANVTRLENRLREEIETYIVQEGDTVSTIAEKFGISTQTILWENKLSARSLIRPGQTLTILPTSGLSHVVTRGETLASIAKRYKVEERSVLEFNEIDDPGRIALGLKLIIPEATPPLVVSPRRPSLPRTPPPGIVPTEGGMILPVRYRRITQWFTWRHSGIDFATQYGTPIWAADDGVVTQAGWGNGYGLFVLIDHGNGLVTRYAHNSKNYVRRGDRVTKGQTIAAIGSTGRSTGPHVHFEVIQNGRFVNPAPFVKL